MKLLKKLKLYNESEIDGSIFGFGIIRAKDYDADKLGHLILWSCNTKKIRFIKKKFVYF